MLREIRTLLRAEAVDKATVCALWEKDLPEEEQTSDGFGVWRMKLLSRWLPKGDICKLIRFAEWHLRIILRYLVSDVDAVHCHSLSSLPLGLALRWLRGASLIYDAHELETESVNTSPLRRRLTQPFERFALRFVDAFFVVGDAIARWYKENCGVSHVTVLRNIPPASRESALSEASSLRARIDIAPEVLLFIYNGVFAHGRGIELILRAFSQTPDQHVVFLGYGNLSDTVWEHAARYSNIHALPAVPPDQLPKMTAGADVGLCLIANVCLSYYYCLPNKLFEYLHGGLAVIGSDFPEIRQVLDVTQAGWTIPPTAEDLAKLLTSLTPEEIRARKLKAAEQCERYTWEHEKEKLLREYARLAACGHSDDPDGRCKVVPGVEHERRMDPE